MLVAKVGAARASMFSTDPTPATADREAGKLRDERGTGSSSMIPAQLESVHASSHAPSHAPSADKDKEEAQRLLRLQNFNMPGHSHSHDALSVHSRMESDKEQEEQRLEHDEEAGSSESAEADTDTRDDDDDDDEDDEEEEEEEEEDDDDEDDDDESDEENDGGGGPEADAAEDLDPSARLEAISTSNSTAEKRGDVPHDTAQTALAAGSLSGFGEQTAAAPKKEKKKKKRKKRKPAKSKSVEREEIGRKMKRTTTVENKQAQAAAASRLRAFSQKVADMVQSVPAEAETALTRRVVGSVIPAAARVSRDPKRSSIGNDADSEKGDLNQHDTTKVESIRDSLRASSVTRRPKAPPSLKPAYGEMGYIPPARPQKPTSANSTDSSQEAGGPVVRRSPMRRRLVQVIDEVRQSRRSAPPMSPVTLERFQAEQVCTLPIDCRPQQLSSETPSLPLAGARSLSPYLSLTESVGAQHSKAMARIKERKKMDDEDRKKRDEADEKLRGEMNRQRKEMQEAKVRKRAEVYALNEALRRAEQTKFEQVLSGAAGDQGV